MKFTAFPNVRTKSKKISKIFSKYDFKDLVVACFCISINRNNRSVLETCLTLNQALLDYNSKNNEKKHIENYQSFLVFFNQIKEILLITNMDDYTVPDFGEVKIVFNGKAYRTFIGTGHTQVYSCLSYLSAIASVAHKENEFEMALEYQDEMISYFENYNTLIGEEGIVKFEFPSEELFYRTKTFFEERIQKQKIAEVSELVVDTDIIENKHFVTYKGLTYPLFNTSLVVDLICNTVSNKQVEKDAVLVGIYDCINYMEQFSGNERGIFAFPTIFLDNNGPIEGTCATFTMTAKKGIVICVDEKTWKNEKNNFIKIEDILEKSDLDVVETRRRNGGSGSLAIHLSASKIKIKYLIYSPVLNINESHRSRISKDKNVFFCTSLDLIDILQLADNNEEIWDYLEFASDATKCNIFSLGGRAGEFLAWKDNNHFFEKGAISFGLIDVGYNSEIESVWDYYRSKLVDYPWGLVDNFLFSNPHIWKIRACEGGFKEYTSKVSGYGGQLITICKISILLCNNLEFYKEEQIETIHHIVHEAIPLAEDILIRMIESCKDIIESVNSIPNTLLQLLFMPRSYYSKVTKNKYDKNRKYVISDASCYPKSICVRYMVNENTLYEDISKAENRSVECLFIEELFMPLKTYIPEFWNVFKNKLNELSTQEKHVGVFQVNIGYKWNAIGRRYNVSDDAYHVVRKRIAKIFAEKDIESGKYFGKEANGVIRKAQRNLIEDFERILCGYSQYGLQLKLMEIYSQVLFSISMHRKRYSSIDEIQEKVKNEVQSKIIREREEFKHQKRVLEYLMESNLFLYRTEIREIRTEELEELLAYSNWLVILSDNADICYFTDEEVHVEITFENVVDVIGNENQISVTTSDIAHRVYEDLGYRINGDDDDKEYYLKAIQAFSEDKKINFAYMIDFLDFLSLECQREHEEVANVFLINPDEMRRQYLSIEGIRCTEEELNSIITFLTVKPDELKTCNGKRDYYLPFGKRNERDNRFELKCLWNRGNKIIYSPVMSYFVKENWLRGMTEFYLPYTIGLKKTVKVLEDWKRKYERQIVFDIEEKFIESGFKKTFHNFDPKKMDKSDKSLLLLGDYDVLAIDDKNKKIWMIECKMLGMVGSFHDMFMQQKRFFYEHKEDEHFQTRIDYMRENYHKVLKYLECNEEEEYEVIPYMVMNKVLISRYKQLEFPIISISELFSRITTI